MKLLKAIRKALLTRRENPGAEAVRRSRKRGPRHCESRLLKDSHDTDCPLVRGLSMHMIICNCGDIFRPA